MLVIKLSPSEASARGSGPAARPRRPPEPRPGPPLRGSPGQPPPAARGPRAGRAPGAGRPARHRQLRHRIGHAHERPRPATPDLGAAGRLRDLVRRGPGRHAARLVRRRHRRRLARARRPGRGVGARLPGPAPRPRRLDGPPGPASGSATTRRSSPTRPPHPSSRTASRRSARPSATGRRATGRRPAGTPGTRPSACPGSCSGSTRTAASTTASTRSTQRSSCPWRPLPGRDDLPLLLGLVEATGEDVVETALRLGLDLLALLREHAPGVDPQPGLREALADGTLERLLRETAEAAR